MSHKNRLLEALGDDETNLSRRELKEALLELSGKRRIEKNSNSTINQIFIFLIGLLVLIAILISMFVLGSRYLFQENIDFGEINKNKSLTKNLRGKLDSASSFFLKPKIGTTNQTPAFFDDKIASGQNYYVQVALCRYVKCSDYFREKLNNLGYSHKVVQLKKNESTPYKEIISAQAMSLQKAQNLSEFINTINDRSGYANVVPAENSMFKVSLGIFPNPDIAEDSRRYFESLAAGDLVQFTYSDSVLSTTASSSKILAGPFATKSTATQAFRKIRVNKNLENSFITAY